MRIKFPQRSKYFEPISSYLKLNTEQLSDGSKLLITFQETYNYKEESFHISVSSANAYEFHTDWWNNHLSLFPARIGALAAVLSKFKAWGDYKVKNSKDGIHIKKIDTGIFLSSFSWDLFNAESADKLLDKSALLHSGTGVPKSIVSFFGTPSDSGAEQIILIYDGLSYQGRLAREKSLGRCRLFWPAEFGMVIDKKFPNLKSIYDKGEEPNQNYWMRFQKISESGNYEIKFSTEKGDSKTKSKGQRKLDQFPEITSKQITELVIKSKGKTFKTIGGNSTFQASKEEKGIAFHVSTGKTRLHKWAFLDRVMNRFNLIHSFKSSYYRDLTVNASYQLALIRELITESSNEEKLEKFDAYEKTPDRKELEERVERLGRVKFRPKAKGNRNPKKIVTQAESYERDPLVVRDVLDRAGGTCELCKKDAPFVRINGEPFLEVHHVVPLSEGGPDLIENAVALCPNCHREAHHGEYANLIKEELSLKY